MSVKSANMSISASKEVFGRDSAAQRPTLVIQPKHGIGDMVWHLPHLHALAHESPQGKVSVLAKRSSRADLLLRADPAISRVHWLGRNPGEHDGVYGFYKLVNLLRSGNFERVWVFHHSSRYQWAAMMAGIPQRFGFGAGMQRFLQTSGQRLRPGIRHPIDKANELLDLHGVRRLETEPKLCVARDALDAVRRDFAHIPRPWIAFGIGSSTPFKQWGGARFVELIRRMRHEGAFSAVLLGGRAETEMAERIVARAGGVRNRVFSAVNLPIDQTAALLTECVLYVGNDTGFLNMAAAVGVDALGLFGSSPPLSHSRRIHPILPDGCQTVAYSDRRMADITVDKVLARAQLHLSQRVTESSVFII